MAPQSKTTDQLTPKQRIVQKVFDGAGRPLTPLEAWEQIRTQKQSMGIATVYRGIQKLVLRGKLRAVEIAETAQFYESTSGPHHHHFYCTRCQKIFGVAACPPNLQALVPAGFQLKDHSITLYGLCRDCAAST